MFAARLAARAATSAGWGLQLLFWLFLLGTTALLTENTLPYFSFARDLPFLIEKAAQYQDAVWRVAFYVHISGGLLCLLVALPQFSRTLLRRAPRLHRALGWTYVVSVLGFAAPTGMYLAIFAKGGMAGRLGFIVLGAVFFYTTWRGLERVRARDFRGHAAWMIRSYAMAASALTFRVFHLLLFVLGVQHEYELSIWLSFVVNLAAAELFLFWRARPARSLALGDSR
ncbi:MAG: DUF2306 domain-containing protein [Planctomycetota bacterium]|nr:DUF2306 domain-containing protein [Planctomycetota bacterium]